MLKHLRERKRLTSNRDLRRGFVPPQCAKQRRTRTNLMHRLTHQQAQSLNRNARAVHNSMFAAPSLRLLVPKASFGNESESASLTFRTITDQKNDHGCRAAKHL